MPSSSSMLLLTSGFGGMELSPGDISTGDDYMYMYDFRPLLLTNYSEQGNHIEPPRTALSTARYEHCYSFALVSNNNDVYGNEIMRVGSSSSIGSIDNYDKNNGIFTTEQLLAPESSAFCDQFLVDAE